jgi:hypothetical protein
MKKFILALFLFTTTANAQATEQSRALANELWNAWRSQICGEPGIKCTFNGSQLVEAIGEAGQPRRVFYTEFLDFTNRLYSSGNKTLLADLPPTIVTLDAELITAAIVSSQLLASVPFSGFMSVATMMDATTISPELIADLPTARKTRDNFVAVRDLCDTAQQVCLIAGGVFLVKKESRWAGLIGGSACYYGFASCKSRYDKQIAEVDKIITKLEKEEEEKQSEASPGTSGDGQGGSGGVGGTVGGTSGPMFGGGGAPVVPKRDPVVEIIDQPDR